MAAPPRSSHTYDVVPSKERRRSGTSFSPLRVLGVTLARLSAVLVFRTVAPDHRSAGRGESDKEVEEEAHAPCRKSWDASKLPPAVGLS